MLLEVGRLRCGERARERADHPNTHSGRLEHCGDEARRRGLSVGACHGDKRNLERGRGDLDLVGDRDVCRPRLIQDLDVERDS